MLKNIEENETNYTIDPFEGMTQNEIIQDQTERLKQYIQSDTYKRLLTRELQLKKMVKKGQIETKKDIGFIDYDNQKCNVKSDIFSENGYLEIDNQKYELFYRGINCFKFLEDFRRKEKGGRTSDNYIKELPEENEIIDYIDQERGTEYSNRFKNTFAYKIYIDLLDGKERKGITSYKIDTNFLINKCRQERTNEMQKILKKNLLLTTLTSQNEVNTMINNRLALLDFSVQNTYTVPLKDTDNIGGAYVTKNNSTDEYDEPANTDLQNESIYQYAENLGINYDGFVFLGSGKNSALFAPIEEYIHSTTDAMYFGLPSTKDFINKITEHNKPLDEFDGMNYIFSPIEIHPKIGTLKYILEKFGIRNISSQKDITSEDIQKLQTKILYLPKDSKTRTEVQGTLDYIGYILGDYNRSNNNTDALRLLNGFADNTNYNIVSGVT